MSQKKILVPVDLTSVADVAIGHAHDIAARVGAEIHLLHLVDSDKEQSAGEERLAAFHKKSVEKLGESVPMHMAVKKGDILEKIGEEAEAMKAMLVVIGTHGLQGMEHIVGTHAVRIIGTAEVPFIVVQEKHIGPTGYENIIVPIEMQAEAKQKMEVVARFGKLFDSKIHLVIPHESDEFLLNALKRNLRNAEDYFAQQGLEHTVTVADKGNDDLDEATFQALKEREGDLIAIMNWRESRIMGVFGTDDTQDILINKSMTPVLVINPKLVSNFELFQTTV